MSVKVMIEIMIKPECIKEFKSKLKKIVPDTRGFDGCIDVHIVGNQDDSLNLFIIETWDSRQHHKKHLGWRIESGIIALGYMLSQAPSIRYFDNLNI